MRTPGIYEARFGPGNGGASWAGVYIAGTTHNVAVGVKPEDAAFIVRACNAHDALVSALSEWEAFDRGEFAAAETPGRFVDTGKVVAYLRANARAALALAKGEA